MLQAFWGEDDVWTASIRYAGEMGGICMAAGIGYGEQNSSPTQTVQLDNGARNLDNEGAAATSTRFTAVPASGSDPKRT